MRFLSKSEVRPWFEGRRVAIVGGGPSAAENENGFIDGHDVVVRVNNYRMVESTGRRADVLYSFFGNSIKKDVRELQRDGVRLCMCKCPDAHAIQSEWHVRRRKMHGVDFRWIYEKRRAWWFCDTYIPTTEDFLAAFDLLGRRVPTTGFSAILDVLSFDPTSVYLTGFDFFRSRQHNLTEAWRENNINDPIGHAPEREREWLQRNVQKYPITCDPVLTKLIGSAMAA